MQKMKVQDTDRSFVLFRFVCVFRRRCRYINCFYWASSANDAYTTQNTSEKFVAILAQIFVENFFMAFILASIISSLDDYSHSRKSWTIYRSKIDAVNAFMRNESFPGDVTNNVREYYK